MWKGCFYLREIMETPERANQLNIDRCLFMGFLPLASVKLNCLGFSLQLAFQKVLSSPSSQLYPVFSESPHSFLFIPVHSILSLLPAPNINLSHGHLILNINTRILLTLKTKLSSRPYTETVSRSWQPQNKVPTLYWTLPAFHPELQLQANVTYRAPLILPSILGEKSPGSSNLDPQSLLTTAAHSNLPSLERESPVHRIHV